jgi:DNA-binding transcriptional LysR family regulator
MHTPYTNMNTPAPTSPSEPSWEDLRVLRAVVQHGSLSLAAAALGITQPTVGRRVAALEEQLGTLLIERSPTGCSPTQAARLMMPYVEQMVAAAEGIARTRHLLHAELSGSVRIACGELIGRLIARRIPSLLTQAPQLHIEILAQTAYINLARGEADIAVRSQPPAGENWVIRSDGTLTFGIYATPAYVEANPAALDPERRMDQCRWITFSADQADMPSARWVRQHITEQAPTLRFDRSSLIIEAALAGAGLVLLPRRIGDSEERLVCVEPAIEGAALQSCIVTSTSAHRIPRIRHVYRWLFELLIGAEREG